MAKGSLPSAAWKPDDSQFAGARPGRARRRGRGGGASSTASGRRRLRQSPTAAGCRRRAPSSADRSVKLAAMESSARPTAAEVRQRLRTARRAVAEVARFVGRPRPARSLGTRRKRPGDFVTAVDVQAERRLRRLVAAAHPADGFLGEELGRRDGEAPWVWVVDPIDGTSNFARGLGIFAVAVAGLFRGQPQVAAVHCEPEGALYSAALGHGAFRGRRRLRAPRPQWGDAAILGVQWHRALPRLQFLGPLQRSGARMRDLGCTVVQLCHVAAGRLDGNVQQQGKIWDLAAAALIAAEAGARCTDWSGRPLLPFATMDAERHYPSIVAAPPVHAALLRLLRRRRGEAERAAAVPRP
jgi:myo-inositol-1(or 4)-monophosphatase